MANANNGHFVWHEHLAKDPKAALAFYSEVVGWKTQAFGEGGEYVMLVGSQGPLGGVMKLPDEAAKMGTMDGAEHPGLKRTAGHLGFLGHGDRVEFRNIRIKNLSTSAVK